MKLAGDKAIYKSGGFTQYGRLDQTKRGSDIFVAECDISNVDEEKIDQIYDEVLNRSKGKDGLNPFLPILDDLEQDKEDEPLLEPFKPFK